MTRSNFKDYFKKSEFSPTLLSHGMTPTSLGLLLHMTLTTLQVKEVGLNMINCQNNDPENNKETRDMEKIYLHNFPGKCHTYASLDHHV